VTQTGAALSSDFERALAPGSDETGRTWISYEEALGDIREQRRWRDRLLSLLRYSVAGGVVELAVPDGTLSDREWSDLTLRAPLRFLIRSIGDTDDFTTQAAPVPRLTLLRAERLVPAGLQRVMILHRPRHIIVLPRNVPDPTWPHRC